MIQNKSFFNLYLILIARALRKSFFLFSLLCFFHFPVPAEDYYKILGVSPAATAEEIRGAYRKLARKYHPDINPDPSAEEKMREINKAYEALKDPDVRKRYDDFGHETFTQSGGAEERANHFSDIFKDVFTKGEGKKAEGRQYSEQALWLFWIIVKNTALVKAETNLSARQVESARKTADISLKSLLKEARVSQINASARQRILNSVYNLSGFEATNEFLKNAEELYVKNRGNKSLSFRLLEKDAFLYKALADFINNVEERYAVEGITAKERKAIELFHRFSFFNKHPEQYSKERDRHLDLLRARQAGQTMTNEEKRELKGFERLVRSDIRIFRKILSQLGLPGHTHHEFLLRSYLDGLKISLFESQAALRGKLLESRAWARGDQTIYMTDRNIIEALRNIKSNFDDLHFQNLRSMSNPFSLKGGFLKSFPPMFIVFQAAIGASLYRQAVTDPQFYGAEKNPEMLAESLSHSLSPTGILSFAIFIAVAQQTHYRLYGLGRLIDGKSVKTPFGPLSFNGKLGRMMAPGAGLGIGFFVSSVFDELIRDPDLSQCAEQIYSGKKEEFLRESLGPCDRFFLNWQSSEKWKHYAVDIVTLIGAGSLSHVLIRQALSAIRSTMIGSSALLKAGKFLGLRASGWIGFFAHIYAFMELHTVLNEWAGQPLKERWTAQGTKNKLFDLTGYLENDFYQLSTAALARSNGLASADTDFLKEKILNAERRIKETGYQFQHWAFISSQFYGQSAQLWTRQLNKLILPYEGSAQLLEDMFALSHFSYGLEIDSNYRWPWDSDRNVEKWEKNWNELNSPGRISSADFFHPEKKREFLIYCPQVTEDMPLWSAFCEDPENFSFTEEYNLHFFYETGQLAESYLSELAFVNEDMPLLSNFMNYAGRGLNELFSSNPAWSVQNLSPKERLYLGRDFIRAGLQWDQSLSHFAPDEIYKFRAVYCSNLLPGHEESEDIAALYELCLSSDQKEMEAFCGAWLEPESEDYGQCLSYFDFADSALKWKMAIKLLSAGLYLAKEFIDGYEKGAIASNYTALLDLNERDRLESLQRLFSLFELNKKGEALFSLPEKIIEEQRAYLSSDQIKELKARLSLSLNPYLFAKNLICGGGEREDILFSAHPLFLRDDIYIYNFYKKEYENIETACEAFEGPQSAFHGFLFDRPVKIIRGLSYENLYLAMESLLKASYPSSSNLADHFLSLSQDQIDQIRNKLAGDLELLTDNYYKKLINKNSPLNESGSLQDFSDYYHKDRILFDISSFEEGLKGLELSLFQTHYWLSALKQLLAMGEMRINENGGPETLNREAFYGWKGFDESAFDQAHLEVLRLLQSYHDSYKKEPGPYLAFPDSRFSELLDYIFNHFGKEYVAEPEKIRELSPEDKSGIEAFGDIEGLLRAWPMGGGASRLAVLQSKYSGSAAPIFMRSDIILSHILTHSIPNLNNSAQARFFETGQTLSEEGTWDRLIYSVLFELNASLKRFFYQFHPLMLKESFENDVDRLKIQH